MRAYQVQAFKHKPKLPKSTSQPEQFWWPENSNFLVVLYRPKDTFYFMRMWEESTAEDFCIDFLNAGQAEFPQLKNPLNTHKWNGIGFQEWCGRLTANEVLSHSGELHLVGDGRPNEGWTLSVEMLKKIQEWVILSEPQLARQSIAALADIAPFDGPA